jgi:hypothetical protein
MFADIPVVDEATHGKQEAVFISSVEFMESPQHVVPSLVWHARTDEVFSFFPHAIHFSSKLALLSWGGRDIFDDREAGLGSHLSAVSGDQRTCQIVERASEVLKNVSSDERKIDGHNNVIAYAVENTMRIRLSLWGNAARVRAKEGIKRVLEITEVVVGPLYF